MQVLSARVEEVTYGPEIRWLTRIIKELRSCDCRPCHCSGGTHGISKEGYTLSEAVAERQAFLRRKHFAGGV